MYAIVQRCFPQLTPAGSGPVAGRSLAARLGELPGFVAHLLLEESNGSYVAVSIFEGQECLAEANGLIDTWFMEPDAPASIIVPAMACGEVIVQRGL